VGGARPRLVRDPNRPIQKVEPMKVIYEFKCPMGHAVEELFPMGTAPASIPCPDHQSDSRRLLSKGNWIAFEGSYKAS
jgi:hypothetical protein